MSIPAPYLSPFHRVPSRRGVRSCSIRARHRRPDLPILDRPNSMLAFALTDASLPTLIRDHISRYKARFNWDHYPHPMIPGARESLPDETHGCAYVTSAFLQVRIALPHRPITHPRLFAPKSRGSSGTTSFPSRWPRRRPGRETRVPIQLGSDHTPRSPVHFPTHQTRTPAVDPRASARTSARRDGDAPARRISIARSALEAPCQTTRVNQHPLLQSFSSVNESRKPHLP